MAIKAMKWWMQIQTSEKKKHRVPFENFNVYVVSPLHVGEIYVRLSNSFYIEVQQPVYENRDGNPNERTCTCVPFWRFIYVQPLLVFFLLLLISVGI